MCSKSASEAWGSAPRWVRIGAVFIVALVTGCVPAPPARDFPPAFLLETEYLEPPAVRGFSGVYKPAAWSRIGHNESAGRAAAFYVSIAAEHEAPLQVRLIDADTGAATSLVQVPPRSMRPGEPPAAEDADVAGELAAGAGVFWIAALGDRAAGLEQRLAVLIPEARLTAFTRLQIFSSVSSRGVPIQPVELVLVQQYFYLAVVGDSIQWGNGLLEADKMSAIVAEAIERETRRKVIVQRYAQSGARIVPEPGDGVCEYSCFGEVPIVRTSITRQAEQIERPELLDLVLMDGCINDVTLAAILSPVTEEAELTDRTIRFCDTEMAALLRKVRALAPQAHIVVTGYFQIVSQYSDPFGLLTWDLASNLFGGSSPEEAGKWVAKLARNSLLFRDYAHAALQAAIDRVNEEARGPAPIRFADPQFGPENAMFSPQRWLWSAVTESSLAAADVGGLQLFPEDPLAARRVALCKDSLAVDPGLTCVYASLGHPNPSGARAYATAVLRCLRDAGILPAE